MRPLVTEAVTVPLETSCKAIDGLVSKLNVQLEQFSSSLSKMSVTIGEKTLSLQSSLASATSVLPNQHASSPSTVINSDRSHLTYSLDRSANVMARNHLFQ